MARRCLGLLLLALAALPAATADAESERLSGRPQVISGDLLSLAGQDIRLYGVDAPEPEQTCTLGERVYPCGRIAATALMDLTAGVAVHCAPRSRDSTGALVAVCRAQGYDLSEGMVYTGWALASPRQGNPYLRFEPGAREARRGLWRGQFVAPWEWRQGKR